MDTDNYITPEEVASRLGVSGSWIRQLCRQGRIPGTRQYGRSWVIPAGAKVEKIESLVSGRPLRTTRIPASPNAPKKGGKR